MGRMNFPFLLGLLLSAVMVTGRGIKVHIASERKNQADAAAAEPEKTEEAIVEAVDAIKNIQADQVADEAADEPEADKRCVRGCPKILSPVCGSNGKTYDNKCLFGIAACWAKKKGLLLTSVKGSCKACDPAWKSWNGNRCKDYGKEKWCKTDGDHYGPKWEKKWGTFKRWANTKGKTALVCPQCGCGEDSNQFDGTSSQKKICQLPIKTGPCRARIPRFAFDDKSQSCHKFYYGGCGGNDNNFKTLKACLDSCATVKEVCVNGETKMDDCNRCQCANGVWACTMMFCGGKKEEAGEEKHGG